MHADNTVFPTTLRHRFLRFLAQLTAWRLGLGRIDGAKGGGWHLDDDGSFDWIQGEHGELQRSAWYLASKARREAEREHNLRRWLKNDDATT